MLSARAGRRWRELNPPATLADKRRARSVAEATASELVRKGATSVVLAGSWPEGMPIAGRT